MSVPVTVPVELPEGVTVSVNSGWKVAVTVLLAFISTVQLAPATLVQPVHEMKRALAAAAAGRTTWSP